MPPFVLASADDPRAAPFRRLNDTTYRRQLEQNGPFGGGLVIVEGWRSLAAAMGSRYRVDVILVVDTRLDRLRGLLDSPGGATPTILVADQETVDAICGFPLHRGVVAAAARGRPQLVENVIGRARALLAIEGVNDAENLGSLFRSAAALGVDGVVLDPTVCDPLSRRCVRVSMGHVLRTELARAPFPEVIDRLRASGVRTFALTPDAGATDIADVAVRPDDRVAVVVGAEGAGLGPPTLERCDERVRIPLRPGIDSLNVAVAAAIGLHRLVPPRRAS